MMGQGRWTVCIRTVSAALLLALLGLCGYVGARGRTAQTASVPVARGTIDMQGVYASSMEQTRKRLEGERTQELTLLQEVLADPAADESLKKQALLQKTQIVQRMEWEAQTTAALSYMGYEGVAVVCGAQAVTVIAPYELAGGEQDRVRMIDAAASQTGLSPESVKIILAKK